MKKEQSIKIITEAAQDEGGKFKLTCAKAFEISRTHDISLKEIGDICDEKKIRIKSCQLGCFK